MQPTPKQVETVKNQVKDHGGTISHTEAVQVATTINQRIKEALRDYPGSDTDLMFWEMAQDYARS